MQPPPVSKRAGLDYAGDVKPAIVNFDWTGEPPPPPVVEEGPEGKTEVEKKVVPVSEILDVIAILVDREKETDSLCLLKIKDTVQSYGDLFFGVGDSLPAPHDGIAVFAINDEEVIFSFAEEGRPFESVNPADIKDDEKGLIVRTDPENVRVPSRLRFDGPSKDDTTTAVLGRTERRNGQYYIGQEDAQMFNTDYQRILSEDVSVETYYDKDGKRAGLKIRSVKAGSLAASHGLQDEDVIISINGHPVTSEQEGIQYVRQNSDNTSIWRVIYLRGGAQREEVYHSPD